MLSDPRVVWQDDRIHIKQSFVEGIVAHLESAYIKGQPPRERLKTEPPQARAAGIIGSVLGNTRDTIHRLLRAKAG